MHQRIDHVTFVDAWLQVLPSQPSKEDIKLLFAGAFDAIWKRSFVTLGEITLSAIFDRVLYSSLRNFPWLDSVTVNEQGFSLHKLPLAALPESDIIVALRVVLIDLLRVLGNLTADALTTQLHLELSKVKHLRQES